MKKGRWKQKSAVLLTVSLLLTQPGTAVYAEGTAYGTGGMDGHVHTEECYTDTLICS